MNWPVFQGGSLEANVRVQEVLRDQAYLTYRKIVLTALQDVENALIAYAKEWEHRKSLNDAVVANRKAVQLATQLYTEGQTDFLTCCSHSARCTSRRPPSSRATPAWARI